MNGKRQGDAPQRSPGLTIDYIGEERRSAERSRLEETANRSRSHLALKQARGAVQGGNSERGEGDFS
jgi:hypothetical protein